MNNWINILDSKYEINQDGIVRNKTSGKHMSPYITRNGYARVSVWLGGKNKSFSIHRLLALAFIENPHDKPHINHKDGNKLNNALDNLEWCTRSENVRHAYDTGLYKDTKSLTKNALTARRRPVYKYSLDGVLIEIYQSLAEAVDKTGIKKSTLREYINENKTKRGFICTWEKVEQINIINN